MLATYIGETDEYLKHGELGHFAGDTFLPFLDEDRPGFNAGYIVREDEVEEAYIRVHMNLRTKSFTVSTRRKGIGWRKYASVQRILLRDVTFKVSEKGRQRAIAEGRRNVHAYAYGFLANWTDKSDRQIVGACKVSYNPFRGETFLTEDGLPVYKAQEVLFSMMHGVRAWGIVS